MAEQKERVELSTVRTYRTQGWFRMALAAVVVAALLLSGCGGTAANKPASRSDAGGKQDSQVALARATADGIVLKARAEATARAIVQSANSTATAVTALARRPANPTAKAPAPADTVAVTPTKTTRATETPTPTNAPAPTATTPPTSTALPKTAAPPVVSVDELQRATVQIVVESDSGDTIGGSGSVVSADGLILTNAHVVYDADSDAFYASGGRATIRVTADPHSSAKPKYLARVVQIDPEADLAVLKVTSLHDGSRLPRGFKFQNVLPLANSDKVQIGDSLRVFGFPGVGGDSVTLSRGVVSGFLSFEGTQLVKTDAQFSHGSSGGAAVNDDGRLIGIPTAGIVDAAGRVGYLIPVNSAKPLLSKAESGAEIAVATPTPATTPSTSTVTLYVDGADQGYTGANVRARPSIESARVGYLANGAPVQAVSRPIKGDGGKDWYRVVYRDRRAYILGSLLSRKEPDAPSTDPPAPSRSKGVTVLSDSSYTDDIDYTHVVGEVRNNTGGSVEFVEVTATFYDKSGKVVGAEFTYTHLDVVPAGGKSPFEILTEIRSSWSRYSLNVDWDKASAAPPKGLDILSKSAYVDDIGSYTIVGEVKNNSGRRMEYVEVVATLYNKRGKVIATNFTYTSPENLRAGQKAPFEISVLEERFAGARYELQVQGSGP